MPMWVVAKIRMPKDLFVHRADGVDKTRPLRKLAVSEGSETNLNSTVSLQARTFQAERISRPFC